MKIINIFGGPGVGKSVFSATLFAYLKSLGKHCEYVTEYAKDCVYQKRLNILQNDQLYILAKQNHKIKMIQLQGNTEYIITDSPLLLSNIYGKINNSIDPSFQQMTLNLFKHYQNINLFLSRTVNYETQGRIQNQKEAIQIDEIIKYYLNKNSITYKEINPKDIWINTKLEF